VLALVAFVRTALARQEKSVAPAINRKTDFSRSSHHAFRFACSLARDTGVRLIVLHVLPPPLATLGGMEGVPPLTPELSREKLEEVLNHVQAPFPEVHVEHRLEEGDPAAGIINVPREAPCDLIVMGTHGRTGLVRLLMGSVAESVARRAPCPVLTVKAPMPENTPAPETQEPVHAG
jgi:nucleotide-binding universal stress UspA family protein